MGKSLRGKECGKGICQRRDGLYHARFVDKAGKRHEKYFQTIPEARNWIEQAKYADKHEDVFCPSDTTVDAWFSFWIENIVGDLAPNTLRNYRERYKQNIQPIIGKMLLSDVKPMHCKKVLLSMDADYAGSTIRQTYITMGTMFKAAKMNDLIAKHPMDSVRFTKPVRAPDDIHFLTRDEQIRFLEVAKRSHNYNQYALILETGLRTGEMIGLTWDAIDFEKRTLTVNKTLEFRHKQHFWRAGPPKTQHSYRTIPLTDRAYEILKEIKDKRPWQKESPLLSQTLEYIDERGQSPGWSCAILSLSTGEQESQRRTVPMIPTYISSAMKQGSNTFVCTPCDIPMLQERLKAVCSRRCCKSCWVMQV
jgi:integrase